MIEIAEEVLEAVKERDALLEAQGTVRDQMGQGSNHPSASPSKPGTPRDTRDDPYMGKDARVDDNNTPP